MRSELDEIPFTRFETRAPSEGELRSAYADVERALRSARTDADRRAALASWEELRRRVGTFGALARLRFRRDTADPKARELRELADALSPLLLEEDARLKRICLEADRRADWSASVGAHALELWSADLVSFDPRVANEVLEEQRLVARYTELIGSARIPFEGESRTLPMLSRFAMDPDRTRRYEAEKARWAWFDANREELDANFDELVAVRTRMARTLGFDDYVGLSYVRRRRIGYDREDVARFRDSVRQVVVPLCVQLAREQAERLGVDGLRLWDEKVHGKSGEAAPLGAEADLVQGVIEGLAALSPRIGEFARRMRDRGLLDLDSRPGKSVGGFCTYLWDYETPFVFANFNGTRHDVRVLVHEYGHAWQHQASRPLAFTDYESCTSETAEVHSMSLEFLIWPELERVFGEGVTAFRRVHLEEQLFFLPYGCAIDHFQHEVYSRPDATPAERHGMWLDCERQYLPWRDHGDLPHSRMGGFWQQQQHVYSWPFYYVDYVLAATCALQFWARSLDDHDGAVADYIALCERGGSLPFADLVASAGLTSPFEKGCLDRVVGRARGWLAAR